MYLNNLVGNKEKSVNNMFITLQPKITRHGIGGGVEHAGNPRFNNST